LLIVFDHNYPLWILTPILVYSAQYMIAYCLHIIRRSYSSFMQNKLSLFYKDTIVT